MALTINKKHPYLKYALIIIPGIFLVMVFWSQVRPFPVADTYTSYFKVTLIGLGLVKTAGDQLPVSEQIRHTDPVTRLDAILEIKKQGITGGNIQLLIDFIRSPQTHSNLKNMAVWALGEIKAESALDFLRSLEHDPGIDQYELTKALRKIRGEYGLWVSIKRQFE
jgi:hypothetical protein